VRFDSDIAKLKAVDAICWHVHALLGTFLRWFLGTSQRALPFYWSRSTRGRSGIRRELRWPVK
jgi:hypothetical protein